MVFELQFSVVGAKTSEESRWSSAIYGTVTDIIFLENLLACILCFQPAAPNHALKISTNRNHVREPMTEFAQVITIMSFTSNLNYLGRFVGV